MIGQNVMGTVKVSNINNFKEHVVTPTFYVMKMARLFKEGLVSGGEQKVFRMTLF